MGALSGMPLPAARGERRTRYISDASGDMPLYTALLFALGFVLTNSITWANSQALEWGADNLEGKDKCGTVQTSKMYDFELLEYKLLTKDKYKLSLHRLVHPSDVLERNSGRPLKKRKPYLLLHGLLGTSAGWVTSAPLSPSAAGWGKYDLRKEIEAVLRANQDKFEHIYESTADSFGGAHFYDKPNKWSRELNRNLAQTSELNFENDQDAFASAFRQAHRKFQMPKKSLSYVSNSLAFTLANFGYDVWMINMRGNHYSKLYEGRLNSMDAEYWNFTIETQVREDLLASIHFIKEANNCDEPIGLVSYSYSSIHVLNLLSNFPAQLSRVRPIIMLAPTLLTANSKPDAYKRLALRGASKLLIAKNGPFPSLGRDTEANSASSFERLASKIEMLICKLPIFSKFCRFLETILYGRTKKLTSVKNLLLGDSQEAMLRRENDCGRTSKAILHQIIDHLATGTVPPDCVPQTSLQLARRRGLKYQRNVILVHALEDEISTPAEVAKMRDVALRELTLVDYLITSKKFSHTDFLFSRENQFLVNAEVVRMAAVHDFVMYRPDVPALPVPRGQG